MSSNERIIVQVDPDRNEFIPESLTITDQGAQLEAAAKHPDAALVRTLTDDLAAYLDRVVVS